MLKSQTNARKLPESSPRVLHYDCIESVNLDQLDSCIILCSKSLCRWEMCRLQFIEHFLTNALVDEVSPDLIMEMRAELSKDLSRTCLSG